MTNDTVHWILIVIACGWLLRLAWSAVSVLGRMSGRKRIL